jgi:hypothetical protein
MDDLKVNITQSKTAILKIKIAPACLGNSQQTNGISGSASKS